MKKIFLSFFFAAFISNSYVVHADTWERKSVHSDDLSVADLIVTSTATIYEKESGLQFANSETERATSLNIHILDYNFGNDMNVIKFRIRVDSNEVIPAIGLAFSGGIRSYSPIMSKIGEELRNGSQLALQILDEFDVQIVTIRHDLSGFKDASKGFVFRDFTGRL